MFRSRFSLVPICVEGIVFAFQMNNITKTKTATADAKFREMAQNVVISSVAATKHSAMCDVTQVTSSFDTRGAVVYRCSLRVAQE